VTVEAAILGASAAVLIVASVSGRIERSLFTSPLLIVILGALGGSVFDTDLLMGEGGNLVFLEITLALVLFSDATRIDLARLRDEHKWPQRMLVIGLPLAIVLGAVAASWLLGLSLGFALLLGVILAPTDAALAEPVLTTKALPKKIRQAVNVESGLNDGLALPGLFLALALVEAEEGLSAADVLLLFIEQLGFGILGGVLFGVFGAWLVGRGMASGWISPAYQKIGTVALALASFAATQIVGGSGFVAAFVAGMVFASRCRTSGQELFEFAEHEASVLVLVAFLIFGAGPLRDLYEAPPTIEIWVLALVSLVLVRPIAVLLSLVGQRLARETRLFFGWFGPRGLASIVFLLTAVDELSAVPTSVIEAVTVTVALSILLHGISAYPASLALARALDRMGEKAMPEKEQVQDLPMRVISMDTGSSG
jgi:sodium/hydrogen antiporter